MEALQFLQFKRVQLSPPMDSKWDCRGFHGMLSLANP